MSKQPHVCVIGSINMDLVTTTKNMPGQGETVLGESFETFPGGKGANQAIAAARVGARVSLVSAIGDDAFGSTLLNHLTSENINVEGVNVIHHASTGIATIVLSENDNRIIVSQGANAHLTREKVEHNRHLILASDIVLIQFEIPMETVQYTVDLAYNNNIPIVINPAPFQTVSLDMLRKATYVTPNEIEFASLADLALTDKMKGKMIVTKGEHGVQFVAESGELEAIQAYDIEVKDTTGAGDTFNGALATEFSRTKNINQAIHFANAAAALSVTRFGAQGGMPTREEVEKFLSSHN